MDPRVIADFVEDEVYLEDGKYRTKSTKDAQLAAYLSSVYSVKFGQIILKLLEVPYLLITGKQASWNSPNSEEYIVESVPEHLLHRAELEGDHLVHAMNIKDTVTEIFKFANDRAEFVATHRKDFPDITFLKSDTALKVKSMFTHMWNGDTQKAFTWDRPAKSEPKL